MFGYAPAELEGYPVEVCRPERRRVQVQASPGLMSAAPIDVVVKI
jgi:hypothetical protein